MIGIENSLGLWASQVDGLDGPIIRLVGKPSAGSPFGTLDHISIDGLCSALHGQPAHVEDAMMAWLDAGHWVQIAPVITHEMVAAWMAGQQPT